MNVYYDTVPGYCKLFLASFLAPTCRLFEIIAIAKRWLLLLIFFFVVLFSRFQIFGTLSFASIGLNRLYLSKNSKTNVPNL